MFGHSPIRLPTPILYATPEDDDNERNTGDSQSDDGAMTEADLDHQKLSLENILKTSAGGCDETSNANKSILTTARRQRLKREIELVKRLDPEHPANSKKYSDLQNQELAVSELWSLWYGERGSKNERRLRAIEDTLVDPSLWNQAESDYLSLIREHCSVGSSEESMDLSNWVEPANRLATLYFLMGRLGESKKWCERVLSAKSWHIGALSGVVMVCLKMGDKEGALKYSLMGLPNLSTQMKSARSAWVKKNVQLAEINLLRLEDLNRKAFGAPDERFVNYESWTADNSQLEGEAGDDNFEWQ